MRSHLAVATTVVPVVFTTLAAIFVGLRQYAQSLKRNPYTPDAYFLFATLLVASAHCGLSIYGSFYAGLGWPAAEIRPVAKQFQKIIYTSQVLWALEITLVRISLLLFYWRVFPSRTFRIWDAAIMGVTTAWCITVIVGTLVVYNWRSPVFLPIDYSAWLVAHGVLNMTMDLVVLSMPLFVIKRLTLSTKRKLAVAGIFWLGLFCVVASAIRVYYLEKLFDTPAFERPFSDVTDLCTIWSLVEPCTSIIAACLPAMAPLLKKQNRKFGNFIQQTISFFSLGSIKRSRHSSQLSNGQDLEGGGEWGQGNSQVPRIRKSTTFTWKAYQAGRGETIDMETRAAEESDDWPITRVPPAHVPSERTENSLDKGSSSKGSVDQMSL